MSPWHIDQVVCVEPRTWAGINRPGGVGKIVAIHQEDAFVASVDVKYMVGGGIDKQLDLDFVRPHAELERQGRARRGRDFFQPSPAKRTTDHGKKDDNKHPGCTTVKKNKKAAEKCTSRTTQRAVHGTETTQTAAKSQSSESDVPASVSFTADECTVSPLPDTPIGLHHRNRDTSKPAHSAKRTLVELSDGNATNKKAGAVVQKSKPKKQATKSKKSKTVRTLADTDANRRFLDSLKTQSDHQPQWKQATLTTLKLPVTTNGKASLEEQKAAPKPILQKKKRLAGHRTKAIAEAILGTSTAGAVRPRAAVETCTSDRVPLKDVYQNQMNRASDFVNDIVGKPTSASAVVPNPQRQVVNSDPTTMVNNESSSPCTLLVTPPEINSDRLKLFTDILGNILMRRQELNVEDVLSHVNGDSKMSGTQPFDMDERDSCLERLNDKNTVMLSDGMVFSLL